MKSGRHFYKKIMLKITQKQIGEEQEEIGKAHDEKNDI